MTKLFISHSGRDNALCRKLKGVLQRCGYDSVFMDIDPEQGIGPGLDWQLKLWQELQGCAAVVAVNTVHWRRSRWCFAEIVVARSLGKALFPLTDGTAAATRTGTGSLMASVQAFPLASVLRGAKGAQPLVAELQRLELRETRHFQWDASRPPYPGLAPLRGEDAAVCFGRSKERQATIELLQRAVRLGDKRMVLIVGPSGSGKSSFMRANIAPHLRGQPEWQVVEPQSRRWPRPSALAAPAPATTVLLLDQIDEVLADPPRARAAWLAGLKRLLGSKNASVLALGTLRSGALEALQQQLPGLVQRLELVLLGPMVRDDWREIIEGPARLAGVPIAGSLVDKLLADVAAAQGDRAQDEAVAADALPMLAATLRQLWDRRDQVRGMTRAAYQDIGGLGAAIAGHAEATVAAAALDDAGLRLLQRHLLSMLRPGPGGRPVRTPLLRTDVDPTIAPLLGKLVDAGLLVDDATPGALELAHESLARTWPRLAHWLRDGREDLGRLQRLEQALQRRREQPQALLDELGLLEARALAAAGFAAAHGAEGRALIADSEARERDATRREVEREQSQAYSESLRLATEGMDVLNAEPDTALRLAWEAWLGRPNLVAERLFRDALQRVPAVALRLARGEWISGIGATANCFFAVEHHKRLRIWTHGGESRAGVALGKADHDVLGVPGGDHLLALGEGRIRLFDVNGTALAEWPMPDAQAKNEEPPRCVLEPGHPVRGVLQWGQWLQTFELDAPAGRIDWLQRWRVCAEERGKGDKLLLHRALKGVAEIDFDARQGQVVTNGWDGMAIVWSTDGAAEWAVQAPGQGFWASAVLTGDGKLFAGTQSGAGLLCARGGSLDEFLAPRDRDLFVLTSDHQRTMFVTARGGSTPDLAIRDSTGHVLVELDAGGGARCAQLSPDESELAVGSEDGCIRIWRVADGRLLHTLRGHAKTVLSLAFSAGTLFSAAWDGEIILWHIESPVLPELRAPGMGSASGWVQLAPVDGGCLLLSGNDGTETAVIEGLEELARLPGRPIAGTAASALPMTRAQQGQVHIWRRGHWARPQWTVEGLAVTQGVVPADGARALLWDPDAKAVSLWRADEPVLLRLSDPDPDGGNDDVIRGAGFHPGGRIVTAARSGRVCLWTAQGQFLRALRSDTGSPDALLSFALHPGGAGFATGGRNAFRLWDWDGRLTRECEVPGYKVGLLLFSPVGARLLCVSDQPGGGGNHAQWWQGDGKSARKLDWPGMQALQHLWWLGPEENDLLAASNDALYDLAAGDLPVLRAPRGEYIMNFAVHADGERVAVLQSDGRLLVWHRRLRLVVLGVRTASRGPLCFSPCGRYVLAGTSAATVETHALQIEALFPAAARRLQVGFSADEIARFRLRQPPRLDIRHSLDTDAAQSH